MLSNNIIFLLHRQIICLLLHSKAFPRDLELPVAWGHFCFWMGVKKWAFSGMCQLLLWAQLFYQNKSYSFLKSLGVLRWNKGSSLLQAPAWVSEPEWVQKTAGYTFQVGFSPVCFTAASSGKFLWALISCPTAELPEGVPEISSPALLVAMSEER